MTQESDRNDPQAAMAEDDQGPRASGRFGSLGRPLDRRNPLVVGFVGAMGVLIAVGLVQMLQRLSQVLTLIVIAAFLAIGLEPLVAALQRRGLSRGRAVTAVLGGLGLVAAVFAAAILPNLVHQATQFATSLPQTVDDITTSRPALRLEQQFGLVTSINHQLRERFTSGDAVVSLFGGVMGAGRAVLSGLFSIITVLVLVPYFLIAERSIAHAGYRLVPGSRRQRVELIGDEIVRRIGGYVAGQVLVAGINAACTFVVITIAGVPYSLVLAILVGLLGIIPLVGATIGAVLVVLVALTDSWQVAALLAVYYLIYQQIENTLIAPRIMRHTVAVPGVVSLISALAGASLLGLVGALTAVPVAAAILLIIEEVYLPRLDHI